jgi:hypothetical protein
LCTRNSLEFFVVLLRLACFDNSEGRLTTLLGRSSPSEADVADELAGCSVVDAKPLEESVLDQGEFVVAWVEARSATNAEPVIPA